MSFAFVVTGVHNAGKSTVIRDLQNRPSAIAYPEIGGELRAKAGCSSWNPCEVFDELVMMREFERDATILEASPPQAVILFEQWHIGNIAHSRIRTPQLAAEYEKRFLHHIASWSGRLAVLHLQISSACMIARESTALDAEARERMKTFYSSLDGTTLELLRKWKLTLEIIDAEQSREQLVKVVRSAVDARLATLDR